MNEPPQTSLARKYATMLRLRTVSLTETHMRDEMRNLAREFPGALRELDELPLRVIEARLALLTTCSAAHPWMVATQHYHQELARALKAKAANPSRAGSLVRATVLQVAQKMNMSPSEADALIFAGLRRRT